MKYRCLLLTFIITACIVSCTEKMHTQRSCTAAAAGDTVIFSRDKAVALFAPCRKGMEATLATISDSRCPKGVECIWAGTVSVELKLNDGFVMKLDVNKPSEFVHEQRHYVFQLVNVLPYPGTGNTSPTAIIRITERDGSVQ